MTFPAGTPILSASFSRAAVTWSRAFPQELLGGGQDCPTAASSGLRQAIEQGHLQRAAVIGELADRQGAQAGDPRQAACLLQSPDPGRGNHPAVAGHDQVIKAELRPDHVDSLGERGRFGGVVGEDPDRDRPALRVGEQPALDLLAALLASRE